MRKSYAKAGLVAAALATILLAIPVAQAGTARNHAVNATIKSSQVATAGGYAIDAGRVTGTGGEGAALIRTKATGPHTIAFKAKVFYPAGSQSAAGSFDFTVNADGTVDFTGNGHYTAGTARFRGVTGQLKVTGSIDANGLATAHVTGNAKY